VFGNPCDESTLQNFSLENECPLIFDAAHCFNVKMRGESVLSWGDISVISFHATKLFQCIEGGALVIKDDEIYRQCKKMINFGLEDDGNIGLVGINGKMNEFQAAMGLAVLEDIEHIQSELKRISHQYDDMLPDGLQKQRFHKDVEKNYSYYPVVFDTVRQLEEVVTALNEEQVYPRRYFFPSLDTVTCFGGSSNCGVSQDLASRILCLPTYAGLPGNDVERIARVIGRRV